MDAARLWCVMDRSGCIPRASKAGLAPLPGADFTIQMLRRCQRRSGRGRGLTRRRRLRNSSRRTRPCGRGASAPCRTAGSPPPSTCELQHTAKTALLLLQRNHFCWDENAGCPGKTFVCLKPSCPNSYWSICITHESKPMTTFWTTYTLWNYVMIIFRCVVKQEQKFLRHTAC